MPGSWPHPGWWHNSQLMAVGEWEGAGSISYISEWRKSEVKPPRASIYGLGHNFQLISEEVLKWLVQWQTTLEKNAFFYIYLATTKGHFLLPCAKEKRWFYGSVVLSLISDAGTLPAEVALLYLFYISACYRILTCLSKIQTRFPRKGQTCKSVCHAKPTRKC